MHLCVLHVFGLHCFAFVQTAVCYRAQGPAISYGRCRRGDHCRRRPFRGLLSEWQGVLAHEVVLQLAFGTCLAALPLAVWVACALTLQLLQQFFAASLAWRLAVVLTTPARKLLHWLAGTVLSCAFWWLRLASKKRLAILLAVLYVCAMWLGPSVSSSQRFCYVEEPDISKKKLRARGQRKAPTSILRMLAFLR